MDRVVWLEHWWGNKIQMWIEQGIHSGSRQEEIEHESKWGQSDRDRRKEGEDRGVCYG